MSLNFLNKQTYFIILAFLYVSLSLLIVLLLTVFADHKIQEEEKICQENQLNEYLENLNKEIHENKIHIADLNKQLDSMKEKTEYARISQQNAIADLKNKLTVDSEVLIRQITNQASQKLKEDFMALEEDKKNHMASIRKVLEEKYVH
jgi:vancomycin resistance protein YoaR